MSEITANDELLSPNAAYMVRVSLRDAVEKSVSLIERDCETIHRQKYNREFNEHERVYLRKLVIKMCVDYLNSAIDAIDHYQKA